MHSVHHKLPLSVEDQQVRQCHNPSSSQKIVMSTISRERPFHKVLGNIKVSKKWGNILKCIKVVNFAFQRSEFFCWLARLVSVYFQRHWKDGWVHRLPRKKQSARHAVCCTSGLRIWHLITVTSTQKPSFQPKTMAGMVNMPTLRYADHLPLKENSQPLTTDGYFVFLQMPEEGTDPLNSSYQRWRSIWKGMTWRYVPQRTVASTKNVLTSKCNQ